MSERHAVKVGSSLLAALVSLALSFPAFAAPVDHYAAGMRQVQQAVAKGDLDLAEKTTLQLSRRYGKNVELLAVRARVLFWQKRYSDSIACYLAARKLKRGPDLDGELRRVQTAQQLAEADRLVAEKQEAKAQKILVDLFESGREPYESGLRLSRLHMRIGDPGGASAVLGRMLQQFPRESDLALLNAQALLAAGMPGEALSFLDRRAETGQQRQLLALRGRALMRLKRFAESAESFRSSLALGDDPEVRSELERAELADLLDRSDRLATRGETAQSLALLREPFEAGRDRYGTGTRLAALYTRSGNREAAVGIYLLLTKEYPKDTELAVLYAQSLVNAGKKEEALGLLDGLQQNADGPSVRTLRARILAAQGRYEEAREEYEKAVRLGAPQAELAAGRSEVEAALNYRHLKAMIDAKAYQAAQPLLKSMAAGRPYRREARLLTVKVLLAQKKPDEAAAGGGELYRDYPGDPEVAALYADALVQAGEVDSAQEVLDGMSGAAREKLKKERGDLFLSARGNWLKQYGGAYGYTNGYGAENSAGVTASRRFTGFTGVVTASETTRFAVTDVQLALDLYLAKRKDANYFGSASLSLSPGADFLPVYTAGLEVTRPFSSLELSAAYNRLQFSHSGANVLSAALLWYLPATTLSLGERVYVVPENGTAMSVTTLRWEPSDRCAAFVSVGAGNSGEKVSSQQDLQRYATFSLRGGTEYRLSPSYSVGGEGSFESRQGLYDRYGASLFLKYWWP